MRNKDTNNIKTGGAITTPSSMGNLEGDSNKDMPLGKINFIGMAISMALIVVGFLLMLGGSSDTEFNPDIFSVRRIVVGPAIAFIGFVTMAISIILKRKK